MSKLKAVDPKAAEPTKPKIMIFGAAGVGKTWTALDFPNVYYIDTEGGANRAHYTDKLKSSGGSYFGIEQGSQDFSEVIGQVEALATEEHHFKTIVLDSGTKLYDLARQEFAEKFVATVNSSKTIREVSEKMDMPRPRAHAMYRMFQKKIEGLNSLGMDRTVYDYARLQEVAKKSLKLHKSAKKSEKEDADVA